MSNDEIVSPWLLTGYYIVKNTYIDFEFKKKEELIIVIWLLLCSQYYKIVDET